ncbi:type II toxin-antitoxin system RelE/ParE family toxin [Oleomonas cavernae]|uniref:Type II toxin-antitoxin system RelE/ParE family toxin n=1 Tax=Oleomonas cavernae TaxID=2320859 RepID=A0A418WBF2_9PROT|nr:type II toxin-antitoxin system RelE/ParE family toxin [Oleomonas cavernae]RJF87335.1 type II toxin-antitoxin system RelE/ParE family toxin [Oleomonas cavernae]
MPKSSKRLPARFFESENGGAPVREWLLSLSAEDRKIIGTDIQTVEFGWPMGMPICRPISGRKGLWEVRSSVPGGRIARVLFCIHEGHMALLHGFEKKTQKTPDRELDIAVKRMKGLD